MSVHVDSLLRLGMSYYKKIKKLKKIHIISNNQ